MTQWLLRREVSPEDIISDPAGKRTIETMKRAQDAGIRTAYVCTQAISMPRSLYIARAVGVDAVPFEATADPPHTVRWIATEMAKSILAVAETLRPNFGADPPSRTVVARAP